MSSQVVYSGSISESIIMIIIMMVMVVMMMMMMSNLFFLASFFIALEIVWLFSGIEASLWSSLAWLTDHSYINHYLLNFALLSSDHWHAMSCVFSTSSCVFLSLVMIWRWWSQILFPFLHNVVVRSANLVHRIIIKIISIDFSPAAVVDFKMMIPPLHIIKSINDRKTLNISLKKRCSVLSKFVLSLYDKKM